MTPGGNRCCREAPAALPQSHHAADWPSPWPPPERGAPQPLAAAAPLAAAPQAVPAAALQRQLVPGSWLAY